MSHDARAPWAGTTIARLFGTTLLVASLFAGLLAGLGYAPRASADVAPPTLLGDPSSGWIPDIPVMADPARAERNPSLTTAANGDLYMAFETDISGSRDVYFASSSDSGLTWTVPVAVATSGVDENSPSITTDPFTGRTFIAYQLGSSGATPIHAAYSDDRITWTDRVVLPCGVICIRPRIVSEYWNGTNNMVYVALSGRLSTNDWNTAIARSSDHGASWTWYESGLSATDVRYQPDIAVHKGSDGVDRVFVVYRGGAAFPGTTGYIEWSANHGSTWAPRAQWYSSVNTPPAIVAAHDGSSLLLAYSTASSQVTWAQVPNPRDLTTFTGTWDFLPTSGTQPALGVDGTGSTATTIGGRYYLVAHDLTGGLFNTTAPVTLSVPVDWSPEQTVTDTGASVSALWPELTITAQDRGGPWEPAVAWTDDRAGNDDVFYSTTGGSTGLRLTITSVPTGQRVSVDASTRVTPATFFVSPGIHTVSVSSPQTGAPGWRYLFLDWSDGGAMSHPINVTADTALQVTFATQVLLTLNSALGAVTGDGWYDLDATATIRAQGPIPGAPGWRWRFDGWTGDLVSSLATETVLMDAPKTIDAGWQQQVELTITSAQGGVSGAGWYDLGGTATLTATTPQSGGTGIRYAFAAWTGDLYSPSLIAFLTMNEPHAVTANWQTEYYLTVSTAHGNVTASEWFAAGDQASITVQATEVTEAGRMWTFTGWSGDATGTSRTLNVTMTGPMTVTANWREKINSPFTGSTMFLLVALIAALALFLVIALLMRRRKKNATYLPMQSAPPGAPPTGPPMAPPATDQPTQPWQDPGQPPPPPPTSPPT
ncbi:MAG TPA: sialidase family protein [Thermoplasmata archaeon]|nr:sialidase family protein [Thermoplasmata archaeon]